MAPFNYKHENLFEGLIDYPANNLSSYICNVKKRKLS